MYPSSLFPGSQPLKVTSGPGLSSLGGAMQVQVPCTLVSPRLRLRSWIFLIYSDSPILVCSTQQVPFYNLKTQCCYHPRGNSQQWGVLLLPVGLWVKSPERHSGCSSEVPREDGATGAHSHELSNTYVGFSSHEDIRASKRLNKYLSPTSKSTRIQTQDSFSRTVLVHPYL